MTEFTDGTAKGKTLSLVELENKIEDLTKQIDKIKQNKFLCKEYKFSVKNTNPVCQATADDITGYSFVCWVRFWTNGTVQFVYGNGTNQKNISIWAGDTNAMSSSVTISGLALYERND